MLTEHKLGNPVSGGDGDPGAVKLPLTGVALSTVAPGMVTAEFRLEVLHAIRELVPVTERDVEACAPDDATSRISAPHVPNNAATAASRMEDVNAPAERETISAR